VTKHYLSRVGKFARKDVGRRTFGGCTFETPLGEGKSYTDSPSLTLDDIIDFSFEMLSLSSPEDDKQVASGIVWDESSPFVYKNALGACSGRNSICVAGGPASNASDT
jgi:hypothetical protein